MTLMDYVNAALQIAGAVSTILTTLAVVLPRGSKVAQLSARFGADLKNIAGKSLDVKNDR